MNDQYANCAHTKRPAVQMNINEDVAIAIGSDYRVMPIFEKGLYEHTYKKYYSVSTNEYLKCRWIECKRHFEERVFAPFTFVDIRDYHFYNCKDRLVPSENIHTKTDYRFKLKPGPGVDFRGQMPIPHELLMKRGEPTHKIAPKKYPRVGARAEKITVSVAERAE